MASAETKEWVYMLVLPNGKFLYKQNGVVKESGMPVPVQHAPDGWKDYIVSYERNTTYFGIVAAQQVPLRFYKDAAFVLRSRLYNNGAEDVVFVVIARLDYISGKHRLFYKAEINFNEYSDDINFFQVIVQEAGLHKLLKAYENTPYEIPFDRFVYVTVGGLRLFNQQPYAPLDGFEIIAGGGIGNVGVNYAIPFAQLTGEGATGNLTFNQPESSDIPTFLYSYQNFLVANKASSLGPEIVQIKGSMDITLVEQPNVGHATFLFFYYIATDTTQTAAIPIPTVGTYIPTYQVSETHTKNFDFNVTLQPGERFYFAARSFADAPNNGFLQKWEYGKGKVTVYSNTQYQNTTVKCKLPTVLGNQLIDKITESDTANSYDLQSPVLDASTIVVTCGDALRRIEGAVIKTSFKDFFNSFNRNLNLGADIKGNTIFIKPKADYFNNTVLHHLGNVKNIRFSYYDEVLVNTLKVGYATQTYDDVNGRFEVNAIQNWKLPLTRVVKELDLSPVYRTDPYGIEICRINLENKTTTDSSADNDVFMLDVEPDGQSLARVRGLDTREYPAGNVLLTMDEDFSEPLGQFEINVGLTEFKYIGPSGNFNVGFALATVQNVLPVVKKNGIIILSDSVAATGFNLSGLFTVTNGDIFTIEVTNPISINPYTVTGSVLQFNNGQTYKLRRPAYDSITGVGDPVGIFNVEFRPKNQILNYGNWLRGAMWPYDNKYITFQTADKNKELVTEIDGVTLVEKDDIKIGDLTAPLFRPIIAEFETVVPDNLIDLMNSNPHGLFSFYSNNKLFKGFVIKASQKPADNAPQQWTLLLSPDTNMNDLIHG